MKRADAGIASRDQSQRREGEHDATHRPVRNVRAITRDRGCRIGAAVFPDTIALPNGWLPEGIAIAPGGTFYSGSRANGAVYGGSLRTGEGAIVVPGRPSRVAVGVDYDRGRLFVAGGATGTASSTTPRRVIRSRCYDFADPPTFVNDVIVTRTAAWFTDSNNAVLYKVPLGPDGTPGPTFETVPLTSLGSTTPPANSNGIDATPER